MEALYLYDLQIQMTAEWERKYAIMVRSMIAGVAGLKTHQSKLDVIGNNIANVNTWSFKAGSGCIRT